ncbi:MAG: glycogen-debranching protein [Phycisphaerae bacterium]|nr:glycogen-debranching protein [Phycisphaerae bacterium]
MAKWTTIEGSPSPLGVTWIPEEQAYNFALYSKHATAVTLLLYSETDFVTPVLAYSYAPLSNKTERIWHCRIKQSGIPDAKYYAYRIDGPGFAPRELHNFNPNKILFDPYATSIFFPPTFDRNAAKGMERNDGKAPLGILPSTSAPFDWGNARPPRHESDAIIYEMHVKGFTAHPSSGVAREKRGTFAGVIEKIPYLQELGVTMVELMPVQQFDPQEGNYWGYMTLNFFAPHHTYASDPVHAAHEFREMMKAFHTAGIEVLLDVVYNHTGEADEVGPMYSYKGIDNSTYYIASRAGESIYGNWSGTGNTLHCSNGAVRTMIVDSLRHWATEYHIDGFRFDLAAIFTRKADGSVNMKDPPVLTAIRSDPFLRKVHLIAEPWDAGGGYQLGKDFPGRLWHQWNDRFRDDLRRFVRGDGGMVTALMQRLYGSDDLFPDTLMDACRPYHNINYIISHDGFTLYDLVSYNEKYNEANGHNNTDGTNDNLSWNCGWEGDVHAPPEVLALRQKQARNLMTLLFLANGIPMIRAGDEFLQSQNGNNNPYNQDNETTWIDWGRLREQAGMFRFMKNLIAFRKAHPTLGRSRYWREDIKWFGTGVDVDMSAHSHALAYHLRGTSMVDCDLYVMINASQEPMEFTVQVGKSADWCLAIDTGLPSPNDIAELGLEQRIKSLNYTVGARSIAVMKNVSKP